MRKDRERQAGKPSPASSQPELNDVWRELLGDKAPQDPRPDEQVAPLPVLSADPWKDLAQARGIEEVDLQQIDLQVSDQEVEQALQVMQEEKQHLKQKPDTGEPGSKK